MRWSDRSRFISLPLLFPNFWLFLNCHMDSALCQQQCETGLEATCVWHHSVNSALRWQQKTGGGGEGGGEESWVELSECVWPECGIGQIESPWLGARSEGARHTLHYRIYGTSSVYLRLQMRMEDEAAPRHLLSRTGNYAYGYPDGWSTHDVTLPPTHTNHQLLLKAFVPYKEAMVAVKGITLDRNLVLTIYPTHNTPGDEASDYPNTGTRNDFDYFPDDDDDDNEMERRFQALEVQNFLGEEDLTKGFTTVVKPQLCMYR